MDIGMNEAAIEYMALVGYRDIVLLTDDSRTWCDSSRPEVSVSFTDGDGSEYEGTHMCLKSPIGKVYVPLSGVLLEEEPRIRYEKHPWIETFELDGIKAVPVCCIWPPAADIQEKEKTEDGSKQ